jgi:hypothetical protein
VELAGGVRGPQTYAAELRARDAEDAQRRAELEMRAVGSPQDREHALKEGRGRYDTGERTLLPEGRIRNTRLELQLSRSRGDRAAAERTNVWLRKMERLHEAGRLAPRMWMTDGSRPDGRPE